MTQNIIVENARITVGPRARTIICYGPPGRGNILDSEALRESFGCTAVIDEWSESQPLTPGARHLINRFPRIAEIATPRGPFSVYSLESCGFVGGTLAQELR